MYIIYIYIKCVPKSVVFSHAPSCCCQRASTSPPLSLPRFEFIPGPRSDHRRSPCAYLCWYPKSDAFFREKKHIKTMSFVMFSNSLLEPKWIRCTQTPSPTPRRRSVTDLRPVFHSPVRTPTSTLTWPVGPPVTGRPPVVTVAPSHVFGQVQAAKMFQFLRSRLQKKSMRKAAKRRTSSTKKTQLQKEDKAWHKMIELNHVWSHIGGFARGS